MKTIAHPRIRFNFQRKHLFSNASWTSFATVDWRNMSAAHPHRVKNLLKGKWVSASSEQVVVDPMNGEKFMYVPLTNILETKEFVDSLLTCPKSGLHNPIKNPERYLLYGDVTAKAAAKLKQPDVLDYFAKLIQRVAPKSTAQGKSYNDHPSHISNVPYERIFKNKNISSWGSQSHTEVS
jgi:hypothetical protein